MQSVFIQYVYLILIILSLVMIANKLRLAYPIILVLGGLLLSFTARFSQIEIDPELVFFIFLPPLLYDAAWQVSWKEFWKWRRVITSFAFPIVILTSCVIAFVSYALIPGFTLALGFLLGGIISPPDAISATTIMRRVKVPRSIVSIVEGESLLNDASSLIVFRFALAAVITGQFYFQDAAISFFLVIVMGILIGLLVGAVFYGIHRWLPTTPSIEIVLSLATPYCMYYFAEHFHFSGVLAVVSGGLFLSNRRLRMLTYRSRIQGLNVWATIGFVLNGLVFLLIGLQLPTIVRQLGDISIIRAIGYGLIISLVLIVARLLCTFGASVFTRVMSHFITVADANPGWRGPVVIGWAGMRGVVSLAAALSIPLLINEGQPFPYRNLILFITFIVILVTLVFQGLTLPFVIRKVRLKDKFTTIPEREQEAIIQKKVAQTSIQYLETKHGKEQVANEHFQNLLGRMQLEFNFFQQSLNGSSPGNARQDFQRIYLELLEHQRLALNEMNHRAEFDEDLIRKYLSLIDLEELKLREKFKDGTASSE
ncbi:Na+/H+ antiporter [Flavisolibacter tropicus]|uniref:Sodium:hydrogen antiporter n=1 Tax=Flavisolibacter tropicus TaxID=1492898 RepID=A0A172TWT3_9BACT|nr:Na+/H+ antiporter [Flavisolibacter tropicus]ANE51442.1 sodium:hydrogen antiporter [Flavisolibacter tropicus]